MKMKNVVFGILGNIKDFKGFGKRRWDTWRPSVDLCRFQDLKIDRFELLFENKFKKIALQTIEDIREISPETEVNSVNYSPKDPWDFEEVYTLLHDYAIDYKFDPENENYLVHMTTGTHVSQICMFILTEARFIPGKLLEVSPPRDTRGGVGSYRIIDLDLSKYDLIAKRFSEVKNEGLSFLKSGIKTKNQDFNNLMEQIERVAANSKLPLLLTGATGVGKTQLASRIYRLKVLNRQVKGKFVEVNCATLRGENAMSTLFGHEKGAFTGAVNKRQGLLKSADQGILFLDEIGELGLDEQAMLLRAVEEKKFYPMGSDTEDSSDFQLIAGTNRDLRQRVNDGLFREDLFARINIWTFRIPSLAERREDIEPNIEFEIEQFARNNNILVRFNKEARQVYSRFALSDQATWNNNFRDLNASISRMATLSTGGRITKEIAIEEIERMKYLWGDKQRNSQEILGEILGAEQIAEIDLFDQIQLAEVLRICKSSKTISDAGRKLFSVSRTLKKNTNDADRLKKYLLKHGLTWARIHS
jgi:transcriptional regulatory protein RtcR